MICGSRGESTEAFPGILINVPVTESEAGAKYVSFVHGEWVCKCNSFALAIVFGVNMYILFILCYTSIVTPHVSFAFGIVHLVGDPVTPFDP